MDGEAQRIRDIPSIEEIEGALQSFTLFKAAFPVLKPILRFMAVDVGSFEEAFEQLNDMKADFEELSSLPDEFNNILVERGWIIYGDMNLDVARRAVECARDGRIEAGERELIQYYHFETIKWHLARLKAGVKAFRPRWRLAEKALEDYEAGRYHACVPVVLALMDGLVQQVHADVIGEGRGMSAEGVNLEAWDSIAAHSAGLERLVEVIMVPRKKTRTEPIQLPYRHGILHGMDLGYDSKTVAAKTWATLFAVGEWARKAEQGELEAPDDKEEGGVIANLQEVARTRERTREIQKRADEWAPRGVVVGDDIPASGALQDYDEGTPERTLVEFLTLWQDGNYGHMAPYLRSVGGGEKVPGQVRDEFEIFQLQTFELKDIQEVSSVFTDIEVELTISQFGEEETKTKKVRLTYMAEGGEPAIVEDGSWVLTGYIRLLSR